jgi:hypothetical protein
VPLDFKQDSLLQPEAKKKEKLLPQIDMNQLTLNVERLGLLFTNFEVKQQVQLLKHVSSVRSTQPSVIFPPISVKQLLEKLFFPIRAIRVSKHRGFHTLMFHPCLHLFLESKGLNNKE